ncbi:MAG: beta-glucosidase [Gemmatimonadetes bacterium]|nr:beta-glucosidase [Gemmatimonadota bacterium]
MHTMFARRTRGTTVLTFAIAAVLALPLGAQGSKAQIEARIDQLLRRMTLEEKVGEMTQLTIEAVSRVHGTADTPQQIDTAKLEDALLRHHVGSLLNVWDVALTPARWLELTTTVQRVAARKRLAIPVIYGIDAVHGFHYMSGATVFPQSIAMAATWNPALVRREHEITAYETRAAGIPWNFAPVLDLGRQPLWSRFFETYGEDVYLATVLGREAVLGEQRDPRPTLDSLFPEAPLRSRGPAGTVFVAATGKHFLGYSAPVSGRDRTTALIPERQLREYYLPTFRAAIDAGLRTVMVNSGDVNGVPVHASHEILTGLLRNELKFDGIAVSDWEDVQRLYTVHHTASSPREAVRQAVMAGVDMSMVPLSYNFADTLAALVRAGSVPMTRIDEAVRRILRVKLELGLFENPWPDSARLARAGSRPFQAASRAAAEEAVTLLKNERGLLPLSKTARVLVTGPGAASLPAQFGSWSYTWQGTDTAVYPRGIKTFLDAVRDRVGAERVTYVRGADFDNERDLAAAVAAARTADVAIVALAEFPIVEKPGDIDDLRLPAAQLRLARAIEATGTPVVLTLFHARPRLVREAVDSARAIVTAYETGPFGGEALAGVLFGDVNPSGRLPFSWPRTAATLVPYDHAESEEASARGPEGGYNPEWRFGHGLSYTTFAYTNLRVGRESVRATDTVSISVDVANTGGRAGKEVVQLYVRDRYASVAPPVRRLRAFDKISLAPGERRTVVFRLPIQRLAFVGIDNRFVVEPGDFDVMIGGLTSHLVVR